MPFLLIGGHAVNAYGMQRQTSDIDLIVKSSQRREWEELFSKIQYQSDQSDSHFIRYRPDTIAAWPIDLMLVDDGTFGKLHSDARSTDLGVIEVKVVSPKHLIMLKLHALKVYQEHRYARDYNDVIQLLRHACPELRNEALRDLCVRYADVALYEKLEKDLT
jgi:predicted nucleotidyltransferase